MNTQNQLIETGKPQRASALAVMASRLQVDPAKLHDTLKNTVFKGASDHELLALAVVANAYSLNPLLKEIYAFPSKGGGLAPIVSIDGWIRITNDHPQFDGIEFEYQDGPDGKPISCTATIYRKDRTRPARVTEYFSECARGTEPWKQFPRRMLRHKALKECSRIAFGFSGITDEDEARDIERNAQSPKAIFAKPAAVKVEEPAPVEVEIVHQEEQPSFPTPNIADHDLWDGDKQPEFMADTPQKRILAELHKAGFSEPEFWDVLKAKSIKTTARTINGISDKLAEGILADWDEMLLALNSNLIA
jgi:phage recombination protein Bet